MDLSQIQRLIGIKSGSLSPHDAGSMVAGGFLRANHLYRDDPGTPDYRWLLVLNGVGWATDEHGQRSRLQIGDGFIRAPKTPHVIEREGDWLEFFISLPPDLYHSLVSVGAIDPHQRRFHLTADDALQASLIGFTRCLSTSVPGQAARIVGAVAELLSMIQTGEPSADDPLDLARQMLESDLDQLLTIARVARMVGLSDDGFRLAFRRRYGDTPKRWRIHARISAAQRLRFMQFSPSRACDNMATTNGDRPNMMAIMPEGIYSAAV